MKKIHVLFICICTLIAACSPSQEQVASNYKADKGNKYYGGVFRLAESEDIKTFFPPSIFDVYSYRIASQVYEGLFTFDMADITKLDYCLIKDYKMDTSSTVYTFYLKDNVYFHDDPCFPEGKGRKMTSKDVEYCFRWACSKNVENKSANLFRGIVEGAEEFYQNSNGDENLNELPLSGFKAIDDTTFQIKLVAPYSQFKYNLARPGAFIFAREAYEKYGEELRLEKCVGTGPFILKAYEQNSSILLERNPNYHMTDEFGNKLPFLDRISVKFIKEKIIELKEFEKGNLDMVYRLPESDFFKIVSRVEEDSTFYLQQIPEMSTQFLTFNNQREPFNDINVRKAFSYAINRSIILDKVLEGQGYDIGKYGFTPPVFKNYSTTKIKGYEFNKDSANYYLAKAGYRGGKGFPEISFDLNVEASRYVNVANEIQKQLKENLNIDIKIELHPMAQLADLSVSGNYELLRIAWIADYPSPQNYLWMLHGKNVSKSDDQISYPNIPRYSNPEFDKYYEQAMLAKTNEEAMALFLKAEQIMIQDAPILVMWYDEAYRIVRSSVQDFPINPMQYRNFSKVYFKP